MANDDDFDQLRCTFPGCNIALHESAAFLPRLGALINANDGNPVKSTDLRKFALCHRHGMKCRDQGIYTFRFTKTREMLEKEKADAETEAKRKEALKVTAEKEKADKAQKAEKEVARTRARDEAFFGQFKPRAPNSTTGGEANEIGPRRPERMRTRV